MIAKRIGGGSSGGRKLATFIFSPVAFILLRCTH